ncbi:MAG: response regulator, partial [Gammaproteobacteria bacterium]|nr:response regulator [Gammaproteobacteria bacterium]
MTRKILVVEDNPEIADLLAMHLKDLNAEIEIIHDGLEGLKKAQTNKYDLIILDLMLPGVNGIEICQKVR